METKGEIMIAPNHPKNDYLSLKITENSDEKTWGKAIEIFKDRIDGRYFSPIHQLSGDINQNGFTIMAVNCLLIETLMQFQRGLGKNPYGKNKEYYTDFILEEFPQIFQDEQMAEKFYSDIRCGILHSGQTKKGARLSSDSDCAIRMDGEVLIISVRGITRELEQYFKEYVQKLSDPENVELRKNFIKKMRFVCRG